MVLLPAPIDAIIISGVPQGSVLGPLLFIFFIEDMHHCVRYSVIRFFADDTRILKHIVNDVHGIEPQKDLDAVIICATESSNNMVLHEDKFEALVHKHNSTWTEFDELPFKISSMIYSTFNGDLIPVEHLRDLGVTVTANL